jgi:hypothetical protein
MRLHPRFNCAAQRRIKPRYLIAVHIAKALIIISLYRNPAV